MSHHIEIFAEYCRLCKTVVDIVAIGKCAMCKMEVIDVNAENTETTENIRKYDITAVPSIVIDGRIKVVGIPNFPWFWAKSFTNF